MLIIIQVHRGFSFRQQRSQPTGVAENAPRSNSSHPMFCRWHTVLFLVRLDNQKDWSHQLHGFGVGRHGDQDVSLHGHLEPSLDHCDWAIEWRVVCTGRVGENVLLESYVTQGHHEHCNRLNRTFRLHW